MISAVFNACIYRGEGDGGGEVHAVRGLFRVEKLAFVSSACSAVLIWSAGSREFV